MEAVWQYGALELSYCPSLAEADDIVGVEDIDRLCISGFLFSFIFRVGDMARELRTRVDMTATAPYEWRMGNLPRFHNLHPPASDPSFRLLFGNYSSTGATSQV